MVARPRFYTLTSQDQYGATHHRGGSDRAAVTARYDAVCAEHIADAVRSSGPVPAWRIRLLGYDADTRQTIVLADAGTIGPERPPLAAIDFLTGETLYRCTPIGGAA